MSNILVRSGGIRGIVVRLGKWFKNVFVQGDVIEIGAATSCSELSVLAMDRELGGLEFLSGIPGSIGGAIRMNAGCFGSDIFNVLLEFEAITRTSEMKWCKARDVKYEYRKTNIPPDWIITRAWFRGKKDIDYSISKKVREIIMKKQESQPLDKRSCGSTFKNPEGYSAWKLIEDAGCKGMKLGGAMVSTKHCNFIVNEGDATPDDIENLGEQVIQKVKQNSGIELEWEIIRLGERKEVVL
jgi:UDP-N-acetylmuramate dehydrogenase